MSGVLLLQTARGRESRIARLLKDCFAHSAFSTAITRELTADFLRWKFMPPPGNARLAVVENDNLPVALVSASPVWISDRRAGRRKAWQIGDIATHPAFRGRGYFRACLAALCDSLPAGDLLFCFPNKNSRNELLRQDFVPVADLDWLARPAWSWRRLSSEPVALDDPCHADHFGDDRDELHIVRDATYLKWRYDGCPTRDYGCLLSGAAQNPKGLLIFRTFRAYVPVAVVTELHGESSTMKSLLSQLDGEARRRGCLSLIAAQSRKTNEVRRRLGMFPVPRGLQPKRLQLLARVAGARAQASRAEVLRPWNIQLGDWDGL